MKIVDKESAASDFFCDVDEMEGSADFPDNTDDDNSEDDYEYPVSGKPYFFFRFFQNLKIFQKFSFSENFAKRTQHTQNKYVLSLANHRKMPFNTKFVIQTERGNF